MDPMQNPEERPETHDVPESGEGKGSLGGTWKKTREGMWAVREQAGQSIEAARERIREGARNALLQQKDKSVAGLKRISFAIHETAGKLNQEGDRTLAEYTDLLGNQVEKAADYLDEREASVLLSDLESFARRQAALFVGGMFVAGLVVARLLKASRQESPGVVDSEPEQSGTTTAEPLQQPGSGSAPPPSRFGAQGPS